MSRDERILGRPEELNLEFFTAINDGDSLVVETCVECGTFSHPPVLYCPRCTSGERRYAPVSGRGTVYSHTTSRYSVEPFWQARLPFTTVVVELEEGVRMLGTARNLARDECVIGTPVVVEVERVKDDFSVLWVDRAGEIGKA